VNNIEQGTIMADREAAILRTNRRQKELLRLKAARRLGVGLRLRADEQSRNVLASHAIVSGNHFEFAAWKGGLENAVLAQADLDPVQAIVWLFTDLRVDEWQHDSQLHRKHHSANGPSSARPLMLRLVHQAK